MRKRAVLLAAATAGMVPGIGFAVVSSNGGGNPPYSGINLNHFLGADRFYTQGYTGTRAVLANVEAGYVWNGHETLTHVNTYVKHAEAKGDFDRHATAIGFMLGGRVAGGNPGEWQRGIADGAEFWSGAIATSWTGTPYTTNFNGSLNSQRFPYHTVMIGGVSGRTSDVVNSSWLSGSRDNSYLFGRKLDAMVSASAKTVVFSAGNAGTSGDPRVAGAGANFNNITVAALGDDVSSPPYNSQAAFSSYGPNGFWNPATQTLVPGVLATVDLAAPGTNITRAFYGGTTGGNEGGTPTPGNDLYLSDGTGTSFAAPIVAGGAALIVDAGKAIHGGGSSIDGRIVKSVLQNSASKTGGWDNDQRLVGGVVTTTRSLDYGVGAGRINLSQAFAQYTVGTADVPALGGGAIAPIGWDFGQVTEGTPTDFYFAAPLQGGTTFTTTLNWFLDNSYNYATDTLVDQSLDNLDLEIWKLAAGVPDTLVAQSKSTYNNVEHLSFTLPETGEYMLRVRWAGEIFDTVADANAEQFGLAWAAVPVPVQWNVDADGDWPDNGNWSGLSPNAPGARAEFAGAIAQPRTVNVAASRTVGQVHFDNAAAGYTIAGPGTITLQTFGGASTLSVAAGDHAISAPLDLQSSVTLDVGSAATLTLSGEISAAGMGISVTKSGDGTVATTRLRVDGLSLAGGTLRFLPDGTVAGSSVVRSLAIAQSAGVSSAALDLADNTLVVDYSGDSPLPEIKNLIAEGYGNGSWSGPGINSTLADGGMHGLGYAEASEVGSVLPILVVDATAVLVRFTRYGDANLDGTTEIADFSVLAANFNAAGLWRQGDFNYDATVNIADFALMAGNFNQSAAAAAAARVPEPAAMAAFAVAAAMARRRVILRR